MAISDSAPLEQTPAVEQLAPVTEAVPEPVWAVEPAPVEPAPVEQVAAQREPVEQVAPAESPMTEEPAAPIVPSPAPELGFVPPEQVPPIRVSAPVGGGFVQVETVPEPVDEGDGVRRD
jgi:hypothetical protein